MEEQLEIWPELTCTIEPYDLVILLRTACKRISDDQYESGDSRAAQALRSMARRGIVKIKTDEAGTVWCVGPTHKSLKNHAG